MPAQQMFYKKVRQVQMAAAREAGVNTEAGFEPASKPQLSPCYTNYPPNVAAFAAIGLTGYLEFEMRVRSGFLQAALKAYLNNPADHDRVLVDPAVYQMTVKAIAQSVETRLLLEDLSRNLAMQSVEMYRLFSASQQTLRFQTLAEIIHCVILYGDVIPDRKNLMLHPLTQRTFEALEKASDPYFAKLATTQAGKLTELGMRWVKEAGMALAPFLPPPMQTKPEAPQSPVFRRIESYRRPPRENADKPQFTPPPRDLQPSDFIPPLEGPNPPVLGEPPSLVQRLVSAVVSPPSPDAANPEKSPAEMEEQKQLREALTTIGNIIDKSTSQQAGWEDMRSDLVESELRSKPFREGPLHGNPTDGHDVTVQLGDQTAGGSIHDRPISLSENLAECEKLIATSAPIANALRRVLYPNVEEIPETEWRCTSGSLDLRRLAVAEISATVFKRYRIRQKANPKGRPVLLIACDGSASLNARQMMMAKYLAAGWLGSMVKSDIQLLAGLYHSGETINKLTGPLVQWMYHPQKTRATTKTDAVRALVSLPNTGTGMQSDALSIAFMLDEAWALARGRMVYLILISDCAWNISFRAGRSGAEEVKALLESVYASHPGRLNITLVGLGVDGQTGFESLVNKAIRVPAAQLGDPAAVAREIGLYVASCMQERKRFLRKS